MKILIVDDSKLVRLMTRRRLQQIGFDDLAEAEDGKEALTLLEGVDVVLTDMTMPGMDGRQLAAAIRARADGQRFGILLTSADDTVAEEAGFAEAGFDGFILKGTDDKQLRTTLEDCHRRRSQA